MGLDVVCMIIIFYEMLIIPFVLSFSGFENEFFIANDQMD